MDCPVCKLQVCNLVFFKFAHSSRIAKSNKNPKIDINFDIRRQLEHFEYDMNLEKQSDWLKIQDSKLIVGPGEQDNGLTIPSGSTRSKCFFKLFCRPVSTY